ncbi:MAG TPA: hypothetical protein GX396_04250 [Tissierellia bacterium]|jgi:hypothetical protein|nr:hypothetical protein [Tissierellia bacterium]
MFNDFMTLDVLTTFTGLTATTMLIVQFTKSLVKNRWGDSCVRIYSFIIALILTFVFARQGNNPQDIVLTIINAIMITVTAAGGYEMLSDPLAKKSK